MSTKKRKLNLFGNKELPSYLLEKNNVIRMILFTTVYSLVFINIFRPFNSEAWIHSDNSGSTYFMYSSLMVLVGMVVVSLSRVIMNLVVKKVQITFPGYLLWLVSDAVVLSIFYVFIAYKVGFIHNYMKENSMTLWESIFDIFKNATANTVWMLLIPYTISLLFLDNQNLRTRLKEMGNRTSESNIVHFKDEKGEIRLSINMENVLYIESADNYVIIKYINNDKIIDFFLRTNLKKLSEDLRDTPIQRCHRSFMINLLHVTSLQKDLTEFTIQFDTTSIKDITVSKTYQDAVMEAFTKYQK